MNGAETKSLLAALKRLMQGKNEWTGRPGELLAQLRRLGYVRPCNAKDPFLWRLEVMALPSELKRIGLQVETLDRRGQVNDVNGGSLRICRFATCSFNGENPFTLADFHKPITRTYR